MRGDERLKVLSAVISGVMLSLAFPLPGIHSLAWAALVPLSVASVKSTPPKSFFLGYLTGAIWTAASLFWTYVYHWLALFSIVAILSLYAALFSLLINILSARIGVRYMAFFIPVVWTALESVKSAGFLGFPWNSLGYSQAANLPVLQIAEYTGVFGVSFVISAVNGIIAGAVVCKRSRAIKFIALGAALVVPAALTVHGQRVMRGFHGGNENPVKIAGVQTSRHPEIPWGEYGHVILGTLGDFTNDIRDYGPFLIVFPETAVEENLDASFNENPAIRGALLPFIDSYETRLLIGAHYLENESLYNSAYLISAEGGIEDRYDKLKLVPGGEHLPYLSRFEFVRRILDGAGAFTPGSERKVFEVNGKRFGVLICFEGIFGDMSRRLVKNGAGFLVNITNDAWSRSRTSHYQHAAIATLRSIENRVYTVRVGNTGITKVIEPSGKTAEELPYWKRGYLLQEINPRPAKNTFYTRNGDVFGYLNLAAFMLLAGVSLFRRRPKDPGVF